MVISRLGELVSGEHAGAGAGFGGLECGVVVPVCEGYVVIWPGKGNVILCMIRDVLEPGRICGLDWMSWYFSSRYNNMHMFGSICGEIRYDVLNPSNAL